MKIENHEKRLFAVTNRVAILGLVLIVSSQLAMSTLIRHTLHIGLGSMEVANLAMAGMACEIGSLCLARSLGFDRMGRAVGIALCGLALLFVGPWLLQIEKFFIYHR